MSAFVSSFLSSNVANMTTLKSELESKLPVKGYKDTFSSGSMASGTYTALVSRSVTLEADDIAFIDTLVEVSAGTTGEQVAVTNFQDAVDLANQVLWTESGGGSGGQRLPLITFTMIQDVVGTVALKTMWARNSGSGTIYTYGGIQRIQIFKRR